MLDFEPAAPDAAAIILLCSSLGEQRNGSGDRPLGPVAFAKLADALRRQSFQGPRDLIGLSADEIARSLGIDDASASSYARRLDRAGQLAFELERLRTRGIWVVTVADAAYPARLAERLGTATPPVLFGSGPVRLLDGGGVAIVGSREADEEATRSAEVLAAAAAAEGTAVVSGGARGIDAVAMRAAFQAGGNVIGVLPEGVDRRLREASARGAVADGQAVLVSPYHPAAGFTAGAAMGRNKLIYVLSDVAVVVSSAEGSGGTWTGALEALAAGWVPVLVRTGPEAPAGNAALVARGAVPLELGVGGADVMDRVREAASHPRQAAETAAPYAQERLFDL